MENKGTNKNDNYLVRESINGLMIGLVLMVIVFLFAHFVLGIEAFS